VGVGGGHKERVKEGNYGGNVSIFMYENRTKKSVKVLRRGRGDKGERGRVVNLIKIYYKHI
jgi:hypothetical protein